MRRRRTHVHEAHFPRPDEDARVVRLVDALREAKADCELVLPWGDAAIRLCDMEPRGADCVDSKPKFTLRLTNANPLREPLTQLSLGSAYVRGDIDIEIEPALKEGEKPSPSSVRTRVDNIMSVFDVRDALRSGTSIGQAGRFLAELALARPTDVNARAIEHHYSLGDEFYLTFLDETYHLYSQCTFDEPGDENAELVNPGDELRSAAQRKLEDVDARLGVLSKGGGRVLDIGGGWGGLLTFYKDCGNVKVTSLTISEDSKKYLEQHKPAKDEVLLEDFLEHRRRGCYDAVAILGVIEHIPTYGRFCEQVWDALKPNGLLYMDASATKQKYAASAFTRRYTWQGPHSCLALPDMIEELLLHGFEILEVHNGSRDYERTMRAWALRLDAAHVKIAESWGESVYRAFRVFLWGGVQGFHKDRLQAYTLVAKRTDSRGPRPGRGRRAAQFVASLR